MTMRGLRERGQSDIINRLACGLFGIELERGGYPSPMIDVDTDRSVDRKSSHRWCATISTRWKPWTVRGGELKFFGKTKGDALDSAIDFLGGLQRRKS